MNSSHDSSCACSHDEVVDQVLVRYYESRQIGYGLVRDALPALAREVDAPAGSTVVTNATARSRAGVVEDDPFIQCPIDQPQVVLDAQVGDRLPLTLVEAGAVRERRVHQEQCPGLRPDCRAQTIDAQAPAAVLDMERDKPRDRTHYLYIAVIVAASRSARP